MNGRGVNNFVAHQKETEDNAPDKQPLPNFKRDSNTVPGIWTVVEDLVGPLLGGQHSDGRENIQDVDKEVLEHNNVEPHIPKGIGIARNGLKACESRGRRLLTWIACHMSCL